MKPSDFIPITNKIQEGIMVDKTVPLEYGNLIYSKRDSSIYWNHIFPTTVLSENFVGDGVEKMKTLKRIPNFYVPQTKEGQTNRQLLTSLGFRKAFEDSWMFFSRKSIDFQHFADIKLVNNSNELSVFLVAFEKCYVKNDSQGPYGELGQEYLDVTKQAWMKLHKVKLDYFIAFKRNAPVAVASLSSYGGVGYISNVGSLPLVRGQGYGKAITLFAVNESIRKGNKYHCLATEEGTYTFEFYKKIGFEKKFSLVAYINNN